MISVLSREQVRAFDAKAIERGVPGVILMENAGRGAAEIIAREGNCSRVVVVCGRGNNGGDGYVVARRLRTLGHAVSVFSVGPVAGLTGDAQLNYAAWVGLGEAVVELADDLTALGGALASATAIVDGLLGTGLDREVGGVYAQVIGALNLAHAPVFALDVPSGLHANTGQVLGVAVKARRTLTFAAPKLGLYTTRGLEHAGVIDVLDIGVPASVGAELGVAAQIVEAADVARRIGRRSALAHKGSAGRVLVVAGSEGKTGAALLAGRAALRAGAGLVTLCSFPGAVQSLEPRVLEQMTATIDPVRAAASLEEHLTDKDAVVVGPGIGLDARARAVVEQVVLGWNGPKVVDADALTQFAGSAQELKKAAGSLLLTPHPGELGRLLECSTADVEADRFDALKRAVELTGAAVLLKGPRTLVGAAEQLPCINPTGTPALATGGSGDVLAGLCGSLIATLKEPYAVGWCGAYLHGRAGELWTEEQGVHQGLLAHEIADLLPQTLAELQTQPPPSP